MKSVSVKPILSVVCFFVLLAFVCSCKKKDMSAEYLRLGRMYETGDSVKRNIRKAFEYYRLAAEEGSGEAMWRVGYCYESGEGVKSVNVDTAMMWYVKSADKLYADAFYSLGFCLEQKGMADSALVWYGKGAELGDDFCMYYLGEYYFTHTDKDPNGKKCIELFTKSAEKDNFLAQYRLGECYRDGKFVNPNFALSISWYKKSAEQGYEDAVTALHNLGVNGY